MESDVLHTAYVFKDFVASTNFNNLVYGYPFATKFDSLADALIYGFFQLLEEPQNSTVRSIISNIATNALLPSPDNMIPTKLAMSKYMGQWKSAMLYPSKKTISALALCYQMGDTLEKCFTQFNQLWGTAIEYYEINSSVIKGKICSPDYEQCYMAPPVSIAMIAGTKVYYYLSRVGLVKKKQYDIERSIDTIAQYIPSIDDQFDITLATGTSVSKSNEKKELAAHREEFDKLVDELANKSKLIKNTLTKEYEEISMKIGLKKTGMETFKCEKCQKIFRLECYIDKMNLLCVDCADNITKFNLSEDYEKYYKVIALHNLLREKSKEFPN